MKKVELSAVYLDENLPYEALIPERVVYLGNDRVEVDFSLMVCETHGCHLTENLTTETLDLNLWTFEEKQETTEAHADGTD